MTLQNFGEAWKTLETWGIAKIIARIDISTENTVLSNKEYIELYTLAELNRIVYNVCTTDELYKNNEKMYNNFIVSVREYCRRIKKSLLEQNDDFLLSYSQNYRKFKLFSYWITKIFAYLNRFYVVHSKKHRLEKICQKIFKINVLEKETSKLVEKITQEIGKMRTEHLSVDSEKIRACFDSFVEIDSSQQLFREKVAKPVLKQTEDFYKHNSKKWSEEMSVLDYLEKVKNLIELETSLYSSLSEDLKSYTAKRIVKECVENNEKLLKHEKEGFCAILEKERYKELALLCNLIQKNPHSIRKYVQQYRKHVSAKCDAVLGNVKSAENPNIKKALVDLAKIHAKHQKLAQDYFYKNVAIVKALNDSFESSLKMNFGEERLAQSFALFFDICLNGHRDPTDLGDDGVGQDDRSMSEVSLLLTFVKRKELFLKKHSLLMATRLVFETTVGIRREKTTLSVIKRHLGNVNTKKLDGMLKDIDDSRKLDSIFNDYLEMNKIPNLLRPKLLSSSNWPKHQKQHFVKPRAMESFSLLFRDFCQNFGFKETLNFSHNIGSVVINADFDNCRNVKIVASPLQASILILLDSLNSITIVEMLNILKVDSVVFKRELKPLVHTRFCGILLKSPSKGYDPSHVLSVNKSCYPKENKITLPFGTTWFADD